MADREPVRLRLLVPRGLLAGLVLLSFSCSFDYRQARLSESLEEGLPDAVLAGVSHTVLDGSQPVMRLTAGRIESYASRKRYIIQTMTFKEFSSDGQELTSGSADRIEYRLDEKSAVFHGAVELYSHDEGGGIKGRDLVWSDDLRTLTGPPEGLVRIEKEDGTWIEGRGLAANLETNEISITKGVRGLLVTEDEDELP